MAWFDRMAHDSRAAALANAPVRKADAHPEADQEARRERERQAESRRLAEQEAFLSANVRPFDEYLAARSFGCDPEPAMTQRIKGDFDIDLSASSFGCSDTRVAVAPKPAVQAKKSEGPVEEFKATLDGFKAALVDFAKSEAAKVTKASNPANPAQVVGTRQKAQVAAKELTNVGVQFVSLVKRPANRMPFRVVKGDSGQTLDLSTLFRKPVKKADPRKPGYAVKPGPIVTALGVLDTRALFPNTAR